MLREAEACNYALFITIPLLNSAAAPTCPGTAVHAGGFWKRRRAGAASPQEHLHPGQWAPRKRQDAATFSRAANHSHNRCVAEKTVSALYHTCRRDHMNIGRPGTSVWSPRDSIPTPCGITGHSVLQAKCTLSGSVNAITQH
ncbi:hypothetical protein NDU88_003846 [Pleurodeles waltl]|uniref:Secreted protein n=1 Tax=Pleurodeles waltl TaxID=8319 RepID=A0AAV7V3J2_PLEWA|nr:hypothetical protein NDU88_003846 [Pleurodeles waltl]